jgi:hypothetical protein
VFVGPDEHQMGDFHQSIDFLSGSGHVRIVTGVQNAAVFIGHDDERGVIAFGFDSDMVAVYPSFLIHPPLSNLILLPENPQSFCETDSVITYVPLTNNGLFGWSVTGVVSVGESSYSSIPLIMGASTITKRFKLPPPQFEAVIQTIEASNGCRVDDLVIRDCTSSNHFPVIKYTLLDTEGNSILMLEISPEDYTKYDHENAGIYHFYIDFPQTYPGNAFLTHGILSRVTTHFDKQGMRIGFCDPRYI